MKKFKDMLGKMLLNSETFSANQFAQLPIKGALDLSIMSSGVITGMVSVNQSGSLYAGQKVTLDTVAGVFTPSFVAASESTTGIGHVIFTSKRSALSLANGDAVEVAINLGHCAVIWMESAATFAAMTKLEMASEANNTVQTQNSNKMIGYALDGSAAIGQLVRVILTQQSLA
jgi:hypothetical protein